MKSKSSSGKPGFFYDAEGSEYGVCPFITFYIYHHEADFLPLADKMIAIHQTLEGMIDSEWPRIEARHPNALAPYREKCAINSNQLAAAQ